MHKARDRCKVFHSRHTTLVNQQDNCKKKARENFKATASKSNKEEYPVAEYKDIEIIIAANYAIENLRSKDEDTKKFDEQMDAGEYPEH